MLNTLMGSKYSKQSDGMEFNEANIFNAYTSNISSLVSN